MVIGLVGPKLSGKGTISDYLVEAHQAKVYSMSGVIVDIVERLHLEKSRKNIIAVATGLRSTLGVDIIAQVLQIDIIDAKDALAVIDGIRFADEIEYFTQLPNFHLIYIDADLKTRHERALKRNEKVGESSQSFEEFKQEEEAETEKGISGLQSAAEHVIVNNNTFEELYKKVEQTLQVIK